MARTKSGNLPPFVKLLTLLQTGEVVTKDEIESKLGNDIYTYRLSTYIWHIKTNTKGVVKVIKDGRIVSGYQLTNPDAIKQFLIDAGAGNFVPGQTTLKPSTAKLAAASVKSLSGLKAKPAKAVKPTKVAAPVEIVAPVIDEVVEITE